MSQESFERSRHHHQEWIKLSSSSVEKYYFNKIVTYQSLQWNHNNNSDHTNDHHEQTHKLFQEHTIDDYVITVAPYGGPIAMMLRPSENESTGAKEGVAFHRRMKQRRAKKSGDGEYDEMSSDDELDEKEYRRRRGKDESDDDSSGDDDDGENGSKFMVSGKAQVIYIYSANGALLSRIQMDKRESFVVNMGWTSDLKLMCLTDEGKLFLFNVQGQVCSDYWNENKDDFVVDQNLNIVRNEKKKMDFFVLVPMERGETVQVSCMWDQGCAVYTTNRRLFVADDFSVKLPFQLYPLTIEMTEKSSAYVGRPVRINKDNTYAYTDMCCMTAIPAHMSQSGTTEIVLSPENFTTLIVCSKHDIVDRQLYNILEGAQMSEDSEDVGIKSLVTSPDGSTVAATFVNNQGSVQCLVFNNQINALYMKFDLRTKLEPTTVRFCSHDCIAVYWKSECFTNFSDSFDDDLSDHALMLLIDCNGVFTNFILENDIFISSECDGLRMYSRDRLETLERVHSSTISLFEIGSFDPGCLLYDAYEDFCSRVPGVIHLVKDMKQQTNHVRTNTSETSSDIDVLLQALENSPNSLQNAVECCIEAACHESNKTLQQKLLKAAIFGRTFLTQTESIVVGLTESERYSVIEQEYKRLFQTNEDFEINPENKRDLVRKMMSQNDSAVNAFYRRCSEMRILFDIRNSVGIPLSYSQFVKLSLTSLVARLCEMNHHFLAHKICEIMNVESDDVLKHWACVKVGSQEDDEVVYNSIISLLKDKKRVSFARIAMNAFQLGKRNLSQKLLAFDGNPMDQIPIYLKMHEVNRALDTAIRSNDSDLVLVVIMYMVKYFDKKHMFEILSGAGRKEACDLYLHYCRNMREYKDIGLFHKFMQDHRGMGMNYIYEGYYHLTEAETESTKKFVDCLTKSEVCFDQSKPDSINSSLSRAQVLLLHLHSQVEKEINQPGVLRGKTAQETLLFLLSDQAIPESKRKEWISFLKSEFNINDKRYWYTRVQAYSNTNNWKSLEDLCFKSSTFRRAPPIGYEPFVEACIKKGNESEALKYIPYVKELEVKVDYYLSLMRFKEAIECSIKDVEMLEYIKKKATNPKTIDSINKLISEL